MLVRRGAPEPAQDAAFANGDVRTIVDHIILHNVDSRLLSIAREAVISRQAATREELRASLGGDTSDEALVDSAVAIADAGARIERVSDPGTRDRRRAAVLERLVWALCAGREPDSTEREAHVRLWVNTYSDKEWTGKKDVVVDGVKFEVHECKFGGGIEQYEIYELGDVSLTARAEGRDCAPTIVTMGSERQIRSRVARLELDEPLFFTVLDDLAVLRDRAPSNRLR